jgi:sarcosine oxidase, subunit gamma
MAEPMMQSPLQAFDLGAKAQAMDGGHGVWVTEIALLGYISLRGDAGAAAFAENVTSVIGAPLPVNPCTISASNGVTVLWISPDEWMIVCERNRLGALIRDLKTALRGVRSQVVDNSGGFTQVLLRGQNALDVLQHASVYNFAALQPGRVVGTTFGKSSVYAYRVEGGFRLLMRRSFADYIWRYLVRAAAPYGLGIAAIEATGHAGQGVA